MLNFFRLLYDKGAFHILLSTFATRFAEFFGTIAVVRLLTKEEYGLVSYVENIYGYLLIFAGLGLSNGLLRFVVLAKDWLLKRAYFVYVLKQSLYRNCCLAGLLLLVNFLIDYPHEFAEAKYWVPLMACLLPLQDLVKDGRFGLRAIFRNKLYGEISLAVSVLLILGRIAGAYWDGSGGVLWSRVIVNAAFACLTVWLAWRANGGLRESGESVALSFEQKKEIKGYSFQYMLTNGLWALFMLNDTFLLGQLGESPSMLADYKVAFVLPAMLVIFAMSVGMFVAPYFTKHEEDKAWVCKHWLITMKIVAAVTGLVAGIMAAGAESIVLSFYGEAYLNIVPLLRMLLLGLFVYAGLGYITVTLLSAMGEIKVNILISLVGMLVQVGMDFWLIPYHGAYGVAYSSIVSYLVMCLAVNAFFVKKYLSI